MSAPDIYTSPVARLGLARGARRQLQRLAQRHGICDRRRTGRALADVGRWLSILHLFAKRGMTLGDRLSGIDDEKRAARETAAHDRGDEFVRFGAGQGTD